MKRTTIFALIFVVFCVSAHSIGNVGHNKKHSDKNNTSTPHTDGIIPKAVTDIDGNTYNAVRLGNQIWMAENLRTTKYADGEQIKEGTVVSMNEAYYYYPNGNSSNMSGYGLLYNVKAVVRDIAAAVHNPNRVQGICPNGWHVPSIAEWAQLTEYVSSQKKYTCGDSATYIAKALASTIGWNSSTDICCLEKCFVGDEISSNNATGFGAMPAGIATRPLESPVGYSDFGNFAYFWSSSFTMDKSLAYDYRLSYEEAHVLRYWDKQNNSYLYSYWDFRCNGHSVRCVKD